MGKSKKKIAQVAEAYQDSIQERFPGLRQELFLESIEGHDAWIRLTVPPELAGSVMEILDATGRMEESIWEETGVNVFTVVVDKKEPVHG